MKEKQEIKCIKCGRVFYSSTHSIIERSLCSRCVTKETMLKRYGVEHNWASKELREKQYQTCEEKYGSRTYNNPDKNKKTCLDRYGVEHHLQKPDILEKQKKTNIKKYGSEWHISSEAVRKKIQNQFLEKYGSKSPFGCPEIQKKGCNNKTAETYRQSAIKASITRSKTEPIDGIYCDSTWEQNFIKTHPGCKRGPIIQYNFDGENHFWNIDFEWNNKLYEVKNPWLLNEDCDWAGRTPAKFNISKDLGIRWYIWNPGQWEWPKLDSIEEFRATKCHVGKLKNPWEAFNDPKLKLEAEENLARYIVWPGMLKRYFNTGRDLMLYKRFTIAKIAPKVTVGSKSEAKKFIQEGINRWGKPKGILNPCAGFGNWKIASEELGLKTKGYDINPDLINFFGWEYNDLLTCEPFETDFWVWTSPPVNDKETWGHDIKLQSKENWYELIQQKIKAPHYIFVNGTDDPTGGLFGNKNRQVLYI